ncbi:hypothetical protein U0358_09390 [Idiomarina sp. PL1-037]|uniref:hypothetical protein n=1 Tax=Idiomarina TaxID=135575 RepID=UPI002ACC0A79|nr:hypothetical protein [Idiomarina sp. PL1-037]WQC52255.1 hypothetical protein U0358_09390 [Idiomarina sp. PL1-037]
MANFDAMVPLIPKDTRVPVDFAREQMKINQVEKIQELRATSEEENSTINEDKQREDNQHHQPQQQASPQIEPEEAADDDEAPVSGHIDTYA